METQNMRHYVDVSERSAGGGGNTHRYVDRRVSDQVAVFSTTMVRLAECDAGAAAGYDTCEASVFVSARL